MRYYTKNDGIMNHSTRQKGQKPRLPFGNPSFISRKRKREGGSLPINTIFSIEPIKKRPPPPPPQEAHPYKKKEMANCRRRKKREKIDLSKWLHVRFVRHCAGPSHGLLSLHWRFSARDRNKGWCCLPDNG